MKETGLKDLAGIFKEIAYGINQEKKARFLSLILINLSHAQKTLSVPSKTCRKGNIKL